VTGCAAFAARCFDLGYGLAAALILIAGAGRVAYGLKGPVFSMGNRIKAWLLDEVAA
jgi:uncharacterized membrane protein